MDMPPVERRQLRRYLRALECRYGPFADEDAWELARLTTESWWTAKDASTNALLEGAKRKHGRGRRPTLQAIDRRQKRQGLGSGTWMQMRSQLADMAAAVRKPRALADVIRHRRGGGEPA
jgi:hypothetical protein